MDLKKKLTKFHSSDLFECEKHLVVREQVILHVCQQSTGKGLRLIICYVC